MFTTKTLSFLRALARNNDRAWFQARRDDYEAHVRAPMAAVVERLSSDLGAVAPDLVIDPRASLFRPWRDTRFSDDKAPLKTHVAATFPHRGLGRMNGAGLYFEVAPRWVWIGGGAYQPDSSQLQAIREHIAGHLERFEAIVAAPGIRRLGGLQGDRLTRPPRGWPADHPAIGYLMHRQFMAFREEPATFAVRPDFYRQLLGTLKALVPLVSFLNEPLVERLAVDRRGHLLAD